MSKEEIKIKDYIDKLMEEMNSKLNSIDAKLDKFIECADNKYASKQIEKFVYGLFGSLIVTLIGIVGYLLDKYTFN